MPNLFYKQKCCLNIPLWKIWKVKLLVVCIIFTFIVGCFLAISPITLDDCRCPNKGTAKINERHMKSNTYDTNTGISSAHKLAVLVPYRDRFEELLAFVPYLHDFLNKQEVSHRIYILNQVDHYRFNRASLINVGFRIARDECDYIAMHDVDLLPLNTQLQYSYPENGPYHIASPDLHPRYHYPTFVGGILLIKREHFELVNGMSNKYWGWGLEDDEFYVRLKEAGLNVSRPVNITTGTENTFKHTHERTYRKRDMTKCFNQRDVTRRRDRQTGLANVAYNLTGIHEVEIDGAPITVINIALSCDRRLTPWCDCSDVGGRKHNNETNALKPHSSSKTGFKQSLPAVDAAAVDDGDAPPNNTKLVDHKLHHIQRPSIIIPEQDWKQHLTGHHTVNKGCVCSEGKTPDDGHNSARNMLSGVQVNK